MHQARILVCSLLIAACIPPPRLNPQVVGCYAVEPSRSVPEATEVFWEPLPKAIYLFVEDEGRRPFAWPQRERMKVFWVQSAGGYRRLPGDTVISVPEARWHDLPSDSLILRLSSGVGALNGFLRRDGLDYVGLAQFTPRELVAARNLWPSGCGELHAAWLVQRVLQSQ